MLLRPTVMENYLKSNRFDWPPHQDANVVRPDPALYFTLRQAKCLDPERVDRLAE
jgi:hypothetical protein